MTSESVGTDGCAPESLLLGATVASVLAVGLAGAALRASSWRWRDIVFSLPAGIGPNGGGAGGRGGVGGVRPAGVGAGGGGALLGGPPVVGQGPVAVQEV